MELDIGPLFHEVVEHPLALGQIGEKPLRHLDHDDGRVLLHGLAEGEADQGEQLSDLPVREAEADRNPGQ